MSWLARSLANSLIPKDDDDDEEEETNNRKKPNEGEGEISSESSRGVKEDLSELTKTLTRQLWGVASFLAPPPSEPSSPQNSDPSISDQSRSEPFDPSVSKDSESESSDSPRIAGIRNDFAEISGKFKTGISRLSNNMAVTEISKIASSFLPFGIDEESEERYSVGGAIGVTDEVLTFARNISMHPETWLDFPLFGDEEDSDDFDISDAQQEHALAVERLAPRLAALRIELCPSHMSEGCFWKIYFVLLHSRLNKHDAELLSTPQIVEARGMLMQDLQNRTKPELDRSGSTPSYTKEAANSVPEEQLHASETAPLRTFAFKPARSTSSMDFETDKHPVVTTDMRIIDKSVIEEGPAIQTKNKELQSVDASYPKYEDDGDDWLDENPEELGGSVGTSIPLGNEEDVSFSDLEEDDDGGSAPTSSKTATYKSDSSTKDSRGWVQLSKSSGESAKSGGQSDSTGHQSSPETKESSDWLSVDDIDVV